MRDPSWAPDDTALIWWEPGAGVYRTAFDGSVAVADGTKVIARVVDAVPAGGGTVTAKIAAKARRVLGAAGTDRPRSRSPFGATTTTKAVRVRR